ncbi:hypothetical protein [Alloactinosynnema sp. L-07]|uniref:hypothetical protein n=1 Tax=Alloactinosynnema sp. L-07 TaxID=1653480 RepID=UPI0012FB67AD|nr:hypothetical protein [Alloactinosynnema sp. L-07]
MPDMLTEVCQVDPNLARTIGQDIHNRATAFAALDSATRDILIAPFMEEVFDHEPHGAPMELKGAVTVVVRNSMLELAHTDGELNEGGIKAITGMATGPLSHLLAAARRHGVDEPADNLFHGVDDRYPRAWACLNAVVAAFKDGGRHGYRLPHAPIPELPADDQLVDANESRSDPNIKVLSAIDARLDRTLAEQLRVIAAEKAVLAISALSRISRNQNKLLWVMEYVLAHESTIVTTNYMLRPGDVWVRRGALIKPNSENPYPGIFNVDGLAGAHRQVVRNLKLS